MPKSPLAITYLERLGNPPPPKWPIVLSLVIGLSGGGLAGAIFSWLANRQPAATILYRTNVAAVAAPEMSGPVPDLKVLVGSESVQSLYVHNVEFFAGRDRDVEGAVIAIEFPKNLHIYGIGTEAPSGAQEIKCEPIPNGFRCTLGAMFANALKPYRVTIATNQKDPPQMARAKLGAELLEANAYKPRRTGFTAENFLQLVSAMSLLAIAMVSVLAGGDLLDILRRRSVIRGNGSASAQEGQEIPAEHA